MAFKSYQAGGIPANFQQTTRTLTHRQTGHKYNSCQHWREPTKNWSLIDMNCWILVQFMMVGPNQPSPQTNQNLTQFIICQSLLQIHLHVHFWTKQLLSGYLMQVSALDVLQCVKCVMRGDCVGVTHSLAFFTVLLFFQKRNIFFPEQEMSPRYVFL